MLKYTDPHSSHKINESDQDSRDRIAANKLSGTVHRRVEIRVIGQFLPSQSCLFGRDETRCQIGINRHLLTRHSIQGKPGRDFTETSRSLRDHNELNNHDNRKQDQSNDELPLSDELSERFDDVTGSFGPGQMSSRQNQSRRSDVQGESYQSGDEQQRRERVEIERSADRNRG